MVLFNQFYKINFEHYLIPNICTFSGTDFYRPGAKNQSVQLDFNMGFVWKLNINC